MPKPDNKKSKPISNRIELATLTSCIMSNPNGEPDGGNAPRQLPDGTGLISHLSEKHKIREYWGAVLGESILYRSGFVRGPYFQELDKRKGDIRTHVCAETLDAKCFGTTITGTDGSLPVHGPVQFEIMRSIDQITPIHNTITCCAPATLKKKAKKVKKGKEPEVDGEELSEAGRMGSQWIVPYALYMGRIFISPTHAQRPHKNGSNGSEFRGTGMTYDDYAKLIEALFYAYEHTRSAGRPGMVRERVFAFEHDSIRGNCRADDLFQRVQIKLRPGVEHPKSYDDYEITVDSKKLPKGVKMYEYYLGDDGEVTRKQL